MSLIKLTSFKLDSYKIKLDKPPPPFLFPLIQHLPTEWIQYNIHIIINVLAQHAVFTVSLSHSVSFSLSVSLSVFSISVYLSLSVSLYISLCIPLSLFLYLSVSLFFFLCISLSLCLFLSLSHSLTSDWSQIFKRWSVAHITVKRRNTQILYYIDEWTSKSVVMLGLYMYILYI